MEARWLSKSERIVRRRLALLGWDPARLDPADIHLAVEETTGVDGHVAYSRTLVLLVARHRLPHFRPHDGDPVLCLGCHDLITNEADWTVVDDVIVMHVRCWERAEPWVGELA